MSWRFSRARRLPEDKDVSPFFFHLEFSCVSEAVKTEVPKKNVWMEHSEIEVPREKIGGAFGHGFRVIL